MLVLDVHLNPVSSTYQIQDLGTVSLQRPDEIVQEVSYRHTEKTMIIEIIR